MKLFSATLSCIALALGLAQADPSHAREMHERHIESQWTISDIDLLESQSSERLVATNEFVIKQRLLPPAAARLDEAIYDADGDLLAEQGAELFGLVSGSGSVYCLDKEPQFNPVGALFVGAVLQAICFKDVDQDGTFDGAFKKKIEIGVLPQLSGKHRRRLREIVGGSFTQIAAEDLSRVYFVGVEFEGRGGIFSTGRSRRFQVAFGGEGKKDSITDWFSTDGDTLPQSVNVSGLGGSFTVLGFEERAIRVRIDEPLKPIPFAVTITVEIY